MGLHHRAEGGGQSRPGGKYHDAGRALSAGAREPRPTGSCTTARSRDARSSHPTTDYTRNFPRTSTARRDVSPGSQEGSRRDACGAAATRGRPGPGRGVAEVGPVPQRAAVGHGARGLQRLAAMRGTTSPTTRPARAPIAGARTGSAGISDDQQRLCFALALWNGKDPILKERLFGLTNSEGNHGEDVKEYYFYLDSTPTHSYMKYLYKYPQAAYPYDDLVETNRAPEPAGARVRAARHRRVRRRSLLRRVRRVRQGVAGGHPDPDHGPQPRPGAGDAARAADALVPQHVVVGRRGAAAGAPAGRRRDRRRDRGLASGARRAASSTADGAATLLFTENETNTERLFSVAQPHAVRQGRDQRLHRPRPAGRGESREDGDEGGGALSA